MANIKRTSALGIAAAAAAGLIVAPAASATDDPGNTPGTSANLAGVFRISGIDRIQVAVEASKAMRPQHTGGTVIIAGSMQFADSLAAAPLADVLDAPVLVTNTGNLDARVAAEIKRLAPERVLILGGEGTVSRAVADAVVELLGGGDAAADAVDRIGGRDRYEVAYNIAAETAAEYTRNGVLPAGSTDSAAAAAQLEQFQQVLQDLVQAQEELVAAQANFNKESREYETALSKAVAAGAAYQVAVQRVADIAKELVVPGTAYTDTQIKDQQDIVAGLVAAYEDKAQGLAFFSGLNGQGGLDIKATLAQYKALSTVDDAAMDEAVADFAADGVTLSTTLEDALSKATVSTNAAQALIGPEAKTLSDMLAYNAEVAADNAANAAVLKRLEAANAAVNAALTARNSAFADLAKAQTELDAARDRLLDAIDNAPAPGEIAHATDAVASARSRVVRAAGNRSVFAARGDIHSDALPAGSAAAEQNGVVLLTTGPTAGAWTTKYLNESQAQVVTIGGFATQALGSKATTKIVGTDRYDNARDVAVKYFNGSEPVAIASGEAYADATVAGAFIANHDGALLLTRGDALSQATEEYLSFQAERTPVRVFGGKATISNDVIVDIEWALTH